jgi:hypothetical protein
VLDQRLPLFDGGLEHRADVVSFDIPALSQHRKPKADGTGLTYFVSDGGDTLIERAGLAIRVNGEIEVQPNPAAHCPVVSADGFNWHRAPK